MMNVMNLMNLMSVMNMTTSANKCRCLTDAMYRVEGVPAGSEQTYGQDPWKT